MSRGLWLQMAMPELRRRPVTHCPMIQPATAEVDHDLNTFCAVCPDACKIPAGCTLSCGWPVRCDTAKCPLSDDCPCAHGCSDERAEQMILWEREKQDRLRAIAEAMK